MQLGHGIKCGAASQAQLSSALPHWNSPLPHSSSMHMRWCGCATGTSTGPKQAVARAFMPVMSVVGKPSR